MNSIWDSTVTVPTYPALHQNITVDAAVIGGGIAGLLIAYQLEKRGDPCSGPGAGPHLGWTNP